MVVFTCHGFEFILVSIGLDALAQGFVLNMMPRSNIVFFSKNVPVYSSTSLI